MTAFETFEKVRPESKKSNRGGHRNGAGRKKGEPNKLSGDLKALILDALGAEGGVEYLREEAREDRKAFCALLGRIVPMQVTGDPDNPLHAVAEIRFTVRDPRH